MATKRLKGKGTGMDASMVERIIISEQKVRKKIIILLVIR
jgi:hypothetical protein